VRIVIIGTAYPMRGGIAHYVALLYRALEKRGHRVHVISFKRQYPSMLFPGKTQMDSGDELIPVKSSPLIDTINPLSWVRAFLAIKRLKPDMLIFKYWMPFFAPCYAFLVLSSKHLLHVPAFYICDNIVPHEKKPLDGFLTRLAFRDVPGFIVQSESVKRDLLRLRPDSLFCFVPHPLYTLFPPPLPKAAARRKLSLKGKRYLLYFGYIRKYKGLPVLIEAMARLTAEMDIHLIVCGEFYEDRDETVSLIRRLHLTRHIRLEDRFIPNEDVGLFFSASDLVVLPYLSATQSGIVKIAYHYEKPVVVTRVGGLPESVTQGVTGYVVPPADPESLARAILRFFNKKKGPVFSGNIRRLKCRYSWERLAVAIESLARADCPGDGQSGEI